MDGTGDYATWNKWGKRQVVDDFTRMYITTTKKTKPSNYKTEVIKEIGVGKGEAGRKSSKEWRGPTYYSATVKDYGFVILAVMCISRNTSEELWAHTQLQTKVNSTKK